VGAVIVLQEIENGPYYVVATGYNHVSPGSKECTEEYGECYRDKKKKEVLASLKFCPGCGAQLQESRCEDPGCPYSTAQGDMLDRLMPGRGLDLCRALHAEESAVLQTSLLGGPSPQDGIMFTTTFPCPLCAKMIVETGIREVAYIEAYPMRESVTMLHSANVELTRFEGVKAQAFVRLFAGHSS
jgi:deoxycytidylate deaminase